MKKIEEKEIETITKDDAGELSLTNTNGKNDLLKPVELTDGNLPDLDDAEVVPFDLNSNYWSPKLPGETKKVFFDAIKISPVQDMKDKEIIIDLMCAFFFEKVNGEIKTVRNGSKRLVAIIENNNIQRLTPIQIEYLGKKQSRNGNIGDDWSVRPLLIPIKQQ